MPISMRPLTEDNMADCVQLSITDEQQGAAHIEPMLELLNKLLDSEDAAAISHWTFYVDNTMVGYAAYGHTLGTKWYEILYFLIDQHWQRRGYGTDAFDALLTELQSSEDCAVVRIRYMDHNPEARGLYAKFGFQEIKEESGYVDAVLLCPQDNPVSLIADFVRVATLAGLPMKVSDIQYEVLERPHHRPSALPPGKMAVYAFCTADKCLKVGKVGKKSAARFTNHHYNPVSVKSNLAKSLLADSAAVGSSSRYFTEGDVADLSAASIKTWIENNTSRHHYYLDATQPPQLLSLLESFLQCRLQPLFEGG